MACLLIFISLIALLLLILLVLLPKAIEEIAVLIEIIPDYTVRSQELIRDYNTRFKGSQLPMAIKAAIETNILHLEEEVVSFLSSLTDRFITFFPRLLGIIITPVAAFYFLKDSKNLREKFLFIFPSEYRPRFEIILVDIDRVLSKYIRGQLTVAACVGILSGIGFYFVGLEFAWLLGVITGAANVIPYFGPIMGAIPAVLVALMHSPQRAIFTILVVLIVQQLDNGVIGPKVMGDSVGLHPVLIIFGLLLANQFFGILGMVLAIPLLAVLKVFVKHIGDILL